ncbi:alpha/beta-hydrolase [Polychaeton citri CBS 116435]|uniref:Alpha/beta-hydrolase n=1 Tax=Polychaeton citri CBS 116435 TaxID=1314669 RepID=A0A9P4Q5G4_9PEZI|nr:alpha/beta-hydrolase [Polychaeton citri CBS 116435]
MLAQRSLPRLRSSIAGRQCQSVSLIRTFSTTRLSNGIELAYDLHPPPSKDDNNNAPVVFIHGFFGSKMNNRSMSKIFARELNRPVYAIDLRNHGDSSHDDRHDYEVLADDVEGFLTSLSLKDSTLIGHSMGAKAAMAVALRNRVSIADLVSVDNSPVDASLKTDFVQYVQGMRKIEDAGITRQSEADAILKDYEESLPIRQFLLTNLIKDQEQGGKLKFRVPLKILSNALSAMGDFPYRDPDATRFEGPTMFVRGSKSPYVADEMLPLIGRFFPKFELVTLEGGHWIISEKPEEFRKAVIEFLQPTE